ncbi:MAG: hypothetical protein A3F72_03060 [Bacteroidetes bacterium RIFCSPLOWO2_12_FULL_35_15]|nr:MAG: hypothetical protein A3F72_03060 [Bacteroidetes bacterium RIFCSPLOWO2_12_FULL_35_15]
MPYKNGKYVYNETVWTDDMLCFLKANYQSMTNSELANALNLRLTTTRTKLYELGLKRMDLEYWNDDQIYFLKKFYKVLGDTEIAELFNVFYNKNKGWRQKHVEKKRRYLQLKRTEIEKSEIKVRNVDMRRYADSHWKCWEGRVLKVGDIRTWYDRDYNRPFKVIKTGSGFVHYGPWLFEQHFGPVPEGFVLRFLDEDTTNVTLENLSLITRAENAMLNAASSNMALSDRYVAGLLAFKKPELKKELLKYPELIELKRNELMLNRQIKKHEQRQN